MPRRRTYRPSTTASAVLLIVASAILAAPMAARALHSGAWQTQERDVALSSFQPLLLQAMGDQRAGIDAKQKQGAFTAVPAPRPAFSLLSRLPHHASAGWDPQGYARHLVYTQTTVSHL
ncbi:MAG: hypothetical protein AB1428_06025 [Bacteroidota bacterium]